MSPPIFLVSQSILDSIFLKGESSTNLQSARAPLIACTTCLGFLCFLYMIFVISYVGWGTCFIFIQGMFISQKGGCTFGVSKVEGGFENLEIKGAPFQVRSSNFQEGLDSYKGNALSWILEVPYFKKNSPVAVTFLCF